MFVKPPSSGKLITYHTYLQERQMYTRTAMDLQNKKEARSFLGGGFNDFLFSPLLGEMIQFD